MAEITLSDGRTISYHDSGSGKTLLLLHSFGHNKNLWYPQLTHFQALGYRVIAPDMPGHGYSSFHPESHTVDLIAQSYIEFLEKINVEKRCGRRNLDRWLYSTKNVGKRLTLDVGSGHDVLQGRGRHG